MSYDYTQARQEVLTWMQDFVEKPNPMLNGWAPCPYARQARLQNRVKVCMGLTPYFDLRRWSEIGMEDLDVIVMIYDPDRWPLAQFRADWQAAQQHWLTAVGLYVLEDHPDAQEQVRGVCMNQGTYALLFLQEHHKLEQAAQQLAAKGYYDHWPEHYLQDLFQGRQDPRS